MLSSQEPANVIITQPSNFQQLSDLFIKDHIENGDVSKKSEALKNLIFNISEGQRISKDLLIFVIRFLLPVQDKRLKKLLLLFWELLPKYQSDGQLITEMILVCDAYRKDLQHPNEYIRGSILRFLCKLKEPQLLEPLMPSIRACLEHKIAYVRRNAVFAIFTIYKNYEYLIPDAPEVVEKFLNSETNPSCLRNAFMMLIHVDQTRAINFLKNITASLLTQDSVLQLAIIDLIYNYCIDSYEKSSFLKYIYELLGANSISVRFAAAETLLALSESPAAFEYASRCYTNLIIKESDNNIRLVVLDRLVAIKAQGKHDRILQTHAFDLLGILTSGGTDYIVDIAVAKRILEFVSSLPVGHIEQIIGFFKKELSRIERHYSNLSQSKDKKKSIDNNNVVAYYSLLIKSLKTFCLLNADVRLVIFPILTRNLSSCHNIVALDILDVARTLLLNHPDFKSCVFKEFISVLPSIRNPNIFRSVFWILSSCVEKIEEIEMISLNPTLPTATLIEDQCSMKPKIAEDGSYITQISHQPIQDIEIPSFKKMIENGCSFVISSLATVFYKLVALYRSLSSSSNINILMILVNLIQHFENKNDEFIDGIDIQRTLSIIQLLSSDFDQTSFSFEKFKPMIIEQKENGLNTINDTLKNIPEHNNNQDLTWTLDFSSIVDCGKKKARINVVAESIMLATGLTEMGQKESQKIDQLIALTGLSDPVYAETFITIHNFDIYLDVLVVNQTNDNIENLSIEFRAKGDFKLINRSPPISLSALKFSNIKATIRISSTNSNIIFGSLSYDTKGANRGSFTVVLDEIKLDLTDQDFESKCSQKDFHNMWLDFLWENKVTINREGNDFSVVVDKIIQATKMTPVSYDQQQSNENNCDFLVQNFYLKNRFGDEAVTNLSLQRFCDIGKIEGHVRIRANTESMALILGQKISQCFKNN